MRVRYCFLLVRCYTVLYFFFFFCKKVTVLVSHYMKTRVDFFDFESINIGGKTLPYCLSYTVDGVIFFKKIDSFSKEEAASFVIDSFKEERIYYSHNLSFDFFLILEGFISVKASVSILCFNNNLYGAKVTKDKKTINFRCSLKLINFSLSKFYPHLYYKKKTEVNFDINLSQENTNDAFLLEKMSEYKIYNMLDVEILMNGFYSFLKSLEELGIEKKDALKHYTPGGIIMSFFVKNYGSIKLSLPDNQKRELKSFFYGGRCEIFGNKKANEKVYHFDYYGMYHLSMYECVPDGIFFLENKRYDNVDTPGFYYIEAELYSEIPVLPNRSEKLMFTNGYVRGWYWFEEIQLALEVSKVVFFEIHKILRCNKYDTFLSKFANDIENFKKKNPLNKKIGKILVNSFYGRLGLGDEIELQYLSKKETDLSINNSFLENKKIKQKPLANVGVASVIASKARIRLYKAFLDVSKNGGRLLYCDTDSVFAAFDNADMIVGKVLGPSNIVFLEENKIEDCVFYKPKTYGLLLGGGVEIIKIKGVNNNDISFMDFKNTKGSITLNKTDIRKMNTSVEIQKKSIKIDVCGYEKRIFIEDNTRTVPVLRKNKKK